MSALRDFAGSISMVVSSCDAFFDAWRPFAFFFRKYWPDCPFPVYLITNELQVRSDRIQPIAVGPDQGWATNMQLALQQIRTPYVLYFQEDYFLTEPVREAHLARDIAFAFEQDAASFCLSDLALLEPEFARPGEQFRQVPVESTGRTRLQAAIWRREALLSAIVPGENAWQMEACGSARTRDLKIFSYTSPEVPIRYLMSGIVRGLWTPEALALCRADGVRIQPAFRGRLAAGKYGRRWRRAIGRVRYPIALAWQRGRVIDLD